MRIPYRPVDTLQDPTVLRELQRIAQAISLLATNQLEVYYEDPIRPLEGQVVICDGTSWDPLADGIKRAIWFNGTTWQAFI